jgi:hypothetical protein
VAFDPSRLKVRRARTHVGELQTEIRRYLRSNPFYVEAVPGAITGTKDWLLHVREQVPPEFSAILGDAIHNLRSALDLLACELVRLNGQSDEDVQFPFSRSASLYPAQILTRHLDRASPQGLAALNTIQPYHGGNDDLRAIHDLDILDKHVMFIPAADMVSMPDFHGGAELLRGIRVSPIKEGWRARIEQEMAPYVGYGRPYQATFSLNFPHHIAPGQPSPLAGREVVPALIQLAIMVDGIVDQFAALYP